MRNISSCIQNLKFELTATRIYDGASYFLDSDDDTLTNSLSSGITETHYIYSAFDRHLCTVEHIAYTKWGSGNSKNPMRTIGNDWYLLFVEDEVSHYIRFDTRDELEEYLIINLDIIPEFKQKNNIGDKENE